MRKQFFVAISLVLAAASMAFAGNHGESILTGVVVMPAGEEFVVDLDGASGLAVGDILEVLQEGEDIVHPTSGAVLGRLETVVATLRVTRLASGHAYAAPLAGEPSTIARGDRVRRPAPATGETNAMPAPQPAAPLPRRGMEEVLFGPSLQGVAVGVEVADIYGDGRHVTVTLFAHRLEIARLADAKLENVATVNLGFAQRAIAIDAADLDGDGRAELYITAVDGGELRSLVVACVDGDCRVIHKNLPWYLRAIPLPGEGRVLLGQKMGWQQESFRGAPFRVQLADHGPVEGAPLPVPPGTSLYGFVPFLDGAGQPLFAQLTAYDLLRVTDAKGDILWESNETFGGSEIIFERVDPHGTVNRRPNELLVFVQPRLEIGPTGELLLPVHDGSRLFKRSQTFDQGRIVALRWNGHSMVEQWRSPEQKAYLADFRLADLDGNGRQELVVAQIFLREGFMSKGRSALALVELP
jgi:hypothetical protein